MILAFSRNMKVMRQTSRDCVECVNGIINRTILSEMIRTFRVHPVLVPKKSYLINVSCSLSDTSLSGKRTLISVSTSVNLGKN